MAASILDQSVLWPIILLVVFAINIVALIVIPRGRKPTAAMAWLLLIFLLPFVGILLFLLIGSVRLPKARRDEQARIDGLIRGAVDAQGLRTDEPDWPRWFQRVVQQNERLTALPATEACATPATAEGATTRGSTTSVRPNASSRRSRRYAPRPSGPSSLVAS